MRDDHEDQTEILKTALQGIRGVFCCTRCKTPWWRVSVGNGDIEIVPDIVVSMQDEWVNSSSDDDDSVTIVRFPRLNTKVMPPKNEMNHIKPDYSQLELPMKMTALKKKNSSELWRVHTRQKSNWGSYFESQSTHADSDELLTDTDEIPIPKVLAPGTETVEDASDWGLTDSYSCHSELSLEIITQNKVVSESKRTESDILLSYMSKNGMRYRFASLNMRIEDIAIWLNRGLTDTIPISEHVHSKRQILENPRTFRKQTLLEVFGNRLDPEKSGITFFIGPVEGKVSFKMCVCDLKLLRSARIDSSDHQRESWDDEIYFLSNTK